MSPHKLLACITAMLLSSVATNTYAAPTKNIPHTEPLIVGVATHLLGQHKDYQHALTLIQKSGATSIRIDAPWQRVEEKRGDLKIPKHWDAVVDAANARHLKVLLILDYGNRAYQHGAKPTTQIAINGFVRYATFVAQHFKKRVTWYEVWNEWDGKAGHTRPGTVAGYVRLLVPTYTALKKVNPAIHVLGGSLTSRAMRSGYLKQLVKAKALHYMDGLAIHPYYQCARNRSTKAWSQWLTRMEHWLRNYTGATVPLYITEIGWPNSIGKCGATTAYQAKKVLATIKAAASLPFIKGLWWYDLVDDGANARNPQDRFGLMTSNSEPKAAYNAFVQAIHDAPKIRAAIAQPD